MKFQPDFVLHGRWPAKYLGVDEAARAAGRRFYHRVQLKNLVSNAGSDTDATGWTNRMCCDQEVADATK